MSRHRNVRNLTEDDYYDDYDDDYDDYDYDNYDDETAKQYSYSSAKGNTKQSSAAAAPIKGKSNHTAAAAAPNHHPAAAKKKVWTAKEKSERERQVQSMGFTARQAKTALEQTHYDVQKALDHILTQTSPSPPTTLPPPPGFSAKPPPFAATSRVGIMENGPSVVKAEKASKMPKSNNKSITAVVPGLSVVSPKPNKTMSSSIIDNSSSSSSKVSQPKPLTDKIKERIQGQNSRLSMVVLGHVDAGKSTLMGQVLLQLGHVQKRTVTKYQKQAAEMGKASFALAWVMDEDDSERERGVTIDIGTKYATTPNHDLTILDAPGHADFIPAMITGAASADVGLLVVAATPGEFEAGFPIPTSPQHSYNKAVTATATVVAGGQTREHVILARGLGVSQLIVAVNKLDAAEPPWSQARFDEIRSRLLPFLKSSGFAPKRIRFVPISGLNGINIKENAMKADSSFQWYKGPTLIDAIDTFVPAKRNIEKPMRFIVTDVYGEGKGVTVRGRMTQGILQEGEKVVVLPIGDEASVNRMEHGTAVSESTSSPYSYAPSQGGESTIGERLTYAMAGDLVEVVLGGIDVARVSVGCILSHCPVGLRPCVQKKVRAKILVMDALQVPIIRGAQVLLHMHSLSVPTVVSKLLSAMQTKRHPNQKKAPPQEVLNPRVLVAGTMSATVELKLSERICIERYSDNRSLGRFVLRRGGDTIAIGVVEELLG